MAILSQAQLLTASNATYIDNTTGLITPTSVRSLNTNWIESSILVGQTASLSVATASLAITALATPNAIVTASAVASTITFTKGGGETFDIIVAQSGSVVSSSFAQTAATAITASFATNANLLDQLDSTAFVFTSSYNPFTASFNSLTASFNSTSASLSTRVTSLESWSASLDSGYVTNAELNASSSALQAGVTSSISVATSNLQAGVTASIAGFANTASNTFTGTNIFNVVTASFVKALSASIDYLSVIYQTSSVIYSSGSNVFGDNANDSQTLWGTVNIVTGPLNATGSANFTGGDFKITDQGRNAELDVDTFKVQVQKSAQITGSVSISGSSFTVNGNVNSANTVNNIYGRTAIYGGDGTGAAQTPRLIISGSDGAYTEIGRASNNINTTVSTTIDASGQIYANPAQTAGQYIGVYTPDTFTVDVEHAIEANSTGVSLSDWDNGSTFAFVPYLTIEPNLGNNPAPQLKRGLGVTGSVNGNVVSASISSNTSSLNFSQGNFFTSLVGSNTFFNVTNPKAGQTANLLLTTSGAATASFSSNVKQVSGSNYIPTPGSGKVDVLTFISFDGTSVYLANIKNLV